MAETPQKTGMWERLEHCDPRYLYLIFALMMVALEFLTVAIPVPVPDTVRSLYDRIEKLPKDKIVIIDCSLDAGYIAEGRGTFEVVAEHLLRRGIPFAAFTNTTFYQGQAFALKYLTPMAARLHKEYGKDYCIWGAVVLQNGAELQALAKDVHNTVKVDYKGTPLADIPMMKNVTDIHNVSLVYRVAYDWQGVQWLGFIQGVYGTPFACGTAAISSSNAYNFIRSGQLCGLLAGAAGSAAYESLLDEKGSGTRVVMKQSFAVLYVVGAIILGNIAMFLVKARKTGAARMDSSTR